VGQELRLPEAPTLASDEGKKQVEILRTETEIAKEYQAPIPSEKLTPKLPTQERKENFAKEALREFSKHLAQTEIKKTSEEKASDQALASAESNLKAGKLSDAEKLFEKARTLNPKTAQAWVQEIGAEIQLGKKQEAKATAEDFRSQFPGLRDLPVVERAIEGGKL
jgi:tetratricopeptide (TPR) repeat protein